MSKEESSEEESYNDVSGEQLLNTVFQLIITATQQMVANGMSLESAKEKTASFLELIVNGLRMKEENDEAEE